MKRLPFYILLLLAIMVGTTLYMRYENDFIRIITEKFIPEPSLRYGHDEELLAFIVSFLDKKPYESSSDLLIFSILNAKTLQKSINLENIFGTTDIYAYGRFIDIYGTGAHHYKQVLQKEVESLRSGFDIGKEGLVFKLVIPTGKRVINIMELGIEPDQVEDIEKMNLTPKANIQVVIPIN